MKPSVGVVIITHQAETHLRHCLPPLLNSSLNPQVLIVNSSSNDDTVSEAQKLGAKTWVIPRDEFNHGTTRELARKRLQTDIVVMMTPDAYPIDNNALEKLVKPLIEKRASIAYGRQLPHLNAKIFESFPRTFNYPTTSHVRTIDDIDQYGIYTFFCSNSFAAWRNDALDEIEGFPEVLLGEDTLACAKLLYNGHTIAYVAEACVRHSHSYSLAQEFRRHFDTGLMRKEYKELLRLGGRDEKRGSAFARSLFAQCCQKYPHLLPYCFCHLTTKWLGYRLGRWSVSAPVSWKSRFSSQDFYWKRRAF